MVRSWEKQGFIFMVIGLLVIGMFLGVAAACTAVLIGEAQAEELTYPCWVMCQPGSEVMIRERPDRRGIVAGSAGCGERLWTDWIEKDGWLHLVDVANESGQGWICEGYVSFSEPEEIYAEMTVTGCRRVASRKGIDGKRTGWIKSGTKVTVYLIGDQWAVTNRGYIHTEYLEAAEE